MNIKKNYKKGIRREIVRIICSCGLFPASSSKFLNNKNTTKYSNMLNSMAKEGILRIIPEPGFRFFKFQAFQLDMLNPADIGNAVVKQYKEYTYRYACAFDGESDINSRRHYYAAQIFILFLGAGYLSFTDEKPSLYDDVNQAEGIFLTSREIKDYASFRVVINKKTHKVDFSKLYGLLLVEKKAYSVYYLTDNKCKVFPNGEHRVVVSVKKMLSTLPSADYSLDGAVIMIHNILSFPMVDKEDGSSKNPIESLEMCYDKCFLLPYDINGQNMLRLMRLPDWERRLYSLCFKSQEKQINNTTFVCDRSDPENDIYILLFCIPDVKKLRKFYKQALYYPDNEWIVLCFDFQEEFIEKTKPENVTVKSTPFDKVYTKLKGDCFEE